METVEKIKHFRQLQHLTQEQMAEQLCISPNTYGSIERGETELSVPRLIKIAAIFQIPPSVLLDSFSDQFIFNSFNVGDISDNSKNSQNFYSRTSIEQLKSKYEIEKQQIIIEQKDKEVTLLYSEIAHLKEIIILLKQSKG